MRSFEFIAGPAYGPFLDWVRPDAPVLHFAMPSGSRGGNVRLSVSREGAALLTRDPERALLIAAKYHELRVISYSGPKPPDTAFRDFYLTALSDDISLDALTAALSDWGRQCLSNLKRNYEYIVGTGYVPRIEWIARDNPVFDFPVDSGFANWTSRVALSLQEVDLLRKEPDRVFLLQAMCWTQVQRIGYTASDALIRSLGKRVLDNNNSLESLTNALTAAEAHLYNDLKPRPQD